jgi:hypothetical protein
VLRRDVRDECLPGSVALDRRELHTSDFRSFRTAPSTTGTALKSHSDTKTPARSLLRVLPLGAARGSIAHRDAHARERTSNVAVSRGWACNATREVRLSWREGAFAVQREVTRA